MNKLMLILIILMFIWGIYFLLNQKEGFVDGNCPTTLIKDGNHILLYDPTKAKVPGVNPIQMKDLEEYKEYIEWQRASKLRCPILHLERVYTTQGTEMYEIRQNFLEQPEGGVMHQNIKQFNHDVSLNINRSPLDMQHLMLKNQFKPLTEGCNGDASLSHPPYNQNQYVAFDKENQTQGNPGVMTLFNS